MTIDVRRLTRNTEVPNDTVPVAVDFASEDLQYVVFPSGWNYTSLVTPLKRHDRVYKVLRIPTNAVLGWSTMESEEERSYPVKRLRMTLDSDTSRYYEREIGTPARIVNTRYDRRGIMHRSTIQSLRICYRELTVPLSSFENTKELIVVFQHAVWAHYNAYSIANVLHREINPGSVLINENRQGRLVDWDMSRWDRAEVRQNLRRKGTWHFLSARLLGGDGHKEPDTGSDDDLESLFYVLLWTAWRNCEHPLSTEEVKEKLTMFKERVYEGRTPLGGEQKLAFIGSLDTDSPDLPDRNFSSVPFKRIIKKIGKILYTGRYKKYPKLSHLDLYLRQKREQRDGPLPSDFDGEQSIMHWRVLRVVWGIKRLHEGNKVEYDPIQMEKRVRGYNSHKWIGDWNTGSKNISRVLR